MKHTDQIQNIALIDGQDWDKLNFEESTFCGPNGRQLLDNRTELRKQLRDPRMRFHLGKLLPWYRPEEIVEFDGSDEMPSWTAFGGRVFDLTGK